MTNTTTTPAAPLSNTDTSTPLWLHLAPLCAMVFAEFLAMGLPLSVLPMQVHGALGFGAFVVGLAIGAQSWVTLLTRTAAGASTDQRGPRQAAVLGLQVSALAGALYVASSAVASPSVSLALLLLGRGLLGLGESFVITSALAWGIALAGRPRTGVVMAWVGVAMYGALALGAPLGAALHGHLGFSAVGAAAALAPLLGLGATLLLRAVPAAGGARLPLHQLARLLWLPGAGLALSAVGFGAIAAFSGLLFQERGWSHAALAMSAFGAAYIAARLLFGGLPDRFGGARVAAVSAATAAAGQLGMWFATSAPVAVAAAAVTGLGFSLAFPAFGIEAMRRVPPQNRGVALGAYAACFDLAMGVGVPALGLLVGRSGFSAAFAVGAAAATGSLFVALALALRAEEQR